MAGLELSGSPRALVDAPLELRLRGGGAPAGIVWRGRIRDDDGRVWKGTARSPATVPHSLRPAKDGGGEVPALLSLRAIALDVRAELPDGRAVGRTVQRVLVDDGVRVRRWREGALRATLALPAPGGGPATAVVLDGRAEDPLTAATARLAAALLASHGAVALHLEAGGDDATAEAAGRLAALPATRDVDPTVLGPDELILPSGIPRDGEQKGEAADRVLAWRALVARVVAPAA